jgi:hypothetical protein
MTANSSAVPASSAKAMNGARPAGKVIPLLALAPLREKVDQLAELRQLVRQAERTERELTQEILAALERAGLDRLAGREVVAVRGERENIQVDVELFHDALGASAYAALSVGVVAARRLMAEDDLRAISTVTTAPVLRLVAIEPRPAAA